MMVLGLIKLIQTGEAHVSCAKTQIAFNVMQIILSVHSVALVLVCIMVSVILVWQLVVCSAQLIFIYVQSVILAMLLLEQHALHVFLDAITAWMRPHAKYVLILFS
jgi:hypothetical protein